MKKSMLILNCDVKKMVLGLKQDVVIELAGHDPFCDSVKSKIIAAVEARLG